MITEEEFNQLPENGGMRYCEEWRNGVKVKIPMFADGLILGKGPGDPTGPRLFTDKSGVTWSIGWANGIRYKTKIGHDLWRGSPMETDNAA